MTTLVPGESRLYIAPVAPARPLNPDGTYTVFILRDLPVTIPGRLAVEWDRFERAGLADATDSDPVSDVGRFLLSHQDDQEETGPLRGWTEIGYMTDDDDTEETAVPDHTRMPAADAGIREARAALAHEQSLVCRCGHLRVAHPLAVLCGVSFCGCTSFIRSAVDTLDTSSSAPPYRVGERVMPGGTTHGILVGSRTPGRVVRVRRSNDAVWLVEVAWPADEQGVYTAAELQPVVREVYPTVAAVDQLADRIERLCDWTADEYDARWEGDGAGREYVDHRAYHHRDYCPYLAVAEVLRGNSDPRHP